MSGMPREWVSQEGKVSFVYQEDSVVTDVRNLRPRREQLTARPISWVEHA